MGLLPTTGAWLTRLVGRGMVFGKANTQASLAGVTGPELLCYPTGGGRPEMVVYILSTFCVERWVLDGGQVE